MLIKFSNITERLSLHIHCKTIFHSVLFSILFPLVFQILALPYLQLIPPMRDWRRQNEGRE